MNNLEQLEGRRISSESKIKDFLFDGKTYDILDFEYHWNIFLSGIFILAAFGKLSWLIGIGWFFLSRLIGMLIIRLDITINGAKIVELHKLKTGSFSLFPLIRN